MPTFLNGPDAQTTKIDSEEGHELKGKPEQEPIEQTSNEQPINGQLPSEQIPNEQVHPENGSGSAVTSISTEVANYDVIAAAVASAHDAAFNKGETTPPPILSGLNGVAQPQVLPEGDKKDLTGKATYPEGAVPITHDEQAKVNPIQGTNGVVHKMQDTRKVLQCPKCPSTFYSKSGYYRHVKKCGEAKGKFIVTFENRSFQQSTQTKLFRI